MEEETRLQTGPEKVEAIGFGDRIAGWAEVDEREKLARLRDIVRAALRQKGDDVCWRDVYNAEVAAIVGVEFDPELLPKEQFIRNCSHYFDSLAAGVMPYKTPDGAEAALPELLAACRAALDYDAAIQRAASKGKRWVDSAELDALYEKWIDSAQAAIAKATQA